MTLSAFEDHSVKIQVPFVANTIHSHSGIIIIFIYEVKIRLITIFDT